MHLDRDAAHAVSLPCSRRDEYACVRASTLRHSDCLRVGRAGTAVRREVLETKDERTPASSVTRGWHNANSLKDTRQALRNANGECAHAPDSHCVAVNNSSANFDHGEIPPSQRSAFSPPRPPPALDRAKRATSEDACAPAGLVQKWRAGRKNAPSRPRAGCQSQRHCATSSPPKHAQPRRTTPHTRPHATIAVASAARRGRSTCPRHTMTLSTTLCRTACAG